MNYHPHTHWIIPGGAISEDGQQWLPSGQNDLINVKALKYHAPYVFRVAIGNRRIVKVEPGPDGQDLDPR